MLLNKSYKEHDVICLKLISGEEIITSFVAESEVGLKVSKPFSITITGTKLGMMPWMFFSDRDVHVIGRNHIISHCLAKNLAAKEYLEKTTGISLGA